MGCKKITYRNITFLEVVHRKNVTENFILGVNRVHLGNVRLSYTDANGNGIIETGSTYFEIIQEKNYCPFGLTHQGYNGGTNGLGNAAAKRYAFGGKELQSESISGNILDWYDFGARNYDPALGRWMNPDPYAEYMYSHSPFNYTFNNPVYFTDPDGLCPNGDCDNVDGSNEGDTTTSDGATWIVWGGSWVRDDGELDEVVVTSSSSPSDDSDNNGESTAGNPTVWGAPGGTETSGRKGTTSSSIEWDDFTTFGGGGASVRNKVLNLIRTIIEGLGIGENVGEEIDKSIHKGTTPLPNESSMENKVESEANNTPKVIRETIEMIAIHIKEPIPLGQDADSLVLRISKTGTPAEREKFKDSLNDKNRKARNFIKGWNESD